MKRYVIGAAVFLVLSACTEQGRAPLVNSGSYDWSDAYYGSNGHHLPGWTISAPK